MPNLLELDLSNNKFKQIEHVGIWRQCHLRKLSASGNRFDVEMIHSPKNTSECSQYALEWLELGDSLDGKIPELLGRLTNLKVLSLWNCKLTGPIPEFVTRLRFLEELDLSDNRLTGPIPTFLGRLSNLDLSSNKLNSSIPESLGLQILDVAYNNLTGTIPHCLRGLRAMVNRFIDEGYFVGEEMEDENVNQVMKGVDRVYTKTWQKVLNMDLSSNKLVGGIPVELTALSGLMGLNLSNNHLSGHIPDTIGNMTNLESLDFSKNELTGIIPPSMADLTFLSHLNLSHNNLSGPIPTGKQLQTLIDPSIYAGNKDLCGAPLPKNCSSHEDPPTTHEKKNEGADEPMKVWFYLDIICGFATGFWGVIGVLLCKKQWRWNLFRFAEETMDKIYVAVVVRVSKMKRGREAI
ncbi:hypothetical protein L1887_31598 [Cichorium endivia]|nr:hypothetical protein L1887_31598 [Cichorium endivia]